MLYILMNPDELMVKQRQSNAEWQQDVQGQLKVGPQEITLTHALQFGRLPS